MAFDKACDDLHDSGKINGLLQAQCIALQAAIDATFLRHHFYAYPETEMVQCQGYAGLHLQLGSLAMGLLPRNWKDRGGVSAYLGVFVPRGSRRRMLRGWLKLWPKGGPNGELAKKQRAQRTREWGVVGGLRESMAQAANDVAKETHGKGSI